MVPDFPLAFCFGGLVLVGNTADDLGNPRGGASHRQDHRANHAWTEATWTAKFTMHTATYLRQRPSQTP